MSIQWALQTVVIFIVGIFILRIGGRKSISQMTIPQTVVMIGIGSLLIQPVSGQVGYELKQNKQPATKEDIQHILQQLNQINTILASPVPIPTNTQESNNIFSEIQTKQFEGNDREP